MVPHILPMIIPDFGLCFLQLVDVYRLVEDQIDMPSVALEVARGNASLNPGFLV